MSSTRPPSKTLGHALLTAPTDTEGSSRHVDRESVYTQLKALLVDYQIAPGAQLLIPPLASRFKISVTPVREALIRLQAEGLVDYRLRIGFFARQLSLSDLADLYHVWYLLVRYGIEESDLAGRDAPKRPRFVASRKLGATEDLLSEREASALNLSIEEFFDEIVRITANQFAVRLIREVHVRTHCVRSAVLQLPGVAKEAISDVEELAERFASRNVIGSYEALSKHSEKMLAELPNALKEVLSRLYAR